MPTLVGRDSVLPGSDEAKSTLLGRSVAPSAPSGGEQPDKSTLIGRTSVAPDADDEDGHARAGSGTLLGRSSSVPPEPEQERDKTTGDPGTLVGGPLPSTIHEDMIARARSQRGSYPSPPSWDEVRESLVPQASDSLVPPAPAPQVRPGQSVPPAAHVSQPPTPAQPLDPIPVVPVAPASGTSATPPARRELPASEVTQLGVPLGGEGPLPSQPPVEQPDLSDVEVTDELEVEALPDSVPPSAPRTDPPAADDGMDIDLQDDPFGTVDAPRVLPPAPIGSAVPETRPDEDTQRTALAAAAAVASTPPPTPPQAVGLPQPIASEPPGPTPSVITSPSAPPTTGLAGGPAPAPLLVDDAPTNDSGSPVLGAIAVAAMLLLAVGGWYLTRGGFVPSGGKAAPKVAAAAAPEAAPVPPPVPAALQPPAAPGGHVAAPPKPIVAPPARRASPVRRPAVKRPAHSRVVRPKPAPRRTPRAASMQVAPVEAAPTKPPVIAIKPASAATPVKPVAVVPRPVIETVRLLETPSRADVRRAFASVHPEVLACSAGRGGIADVDLTVLSNGRVSIVKVGGDYAGTPHGSCMARAIRKARFAPFIKPKFRIIYPVQL